MQWSISVTATKELAQRHIDDQRPPDGCSPDSQAQFERAKALLREEVREAAGPGVAVNAKGNGRGVKIVVHSVELAAPPDDLPELAEPSDNADGKRNE